MIEEQMTDSPLDCGGQTAGNRPRRLKTCGDASRALAFVAKSVSFNDVPLEVTREIFSITRESYPNKKGTGETRFNLSFLLARVFRHLRSIV
jgi:hypothetical protein